MPLSRIWVLSSGVAVSAIVLAHASHASDFTIVNGQTEPTTQTLDTAGNVGTVEVGGTINVSDGDAIRATANGVTIVNAGTATGASSFPSLFSGIAVFDSNTVTNSGTTEGFFGIDARNNNTIINSGTALGDATAIHTESNNTIINSGIARGGTVGITAGDGSTITNTGTIFGNFAAVDFSGTGNTLNLLAGSNIQGKLDLGTGDTLNIAFSNNAALTFTGTPTINVEGMPSVVSGGVVYVVDPTGFSADDEMVADLTGIVTGAVDERLSASRQGPGTTSVAMNGIAITPVADVPDGSDTMAWAKVLGNYGDHKADGNISGFETLLAGLVVGVDSPTSENARAGAFIGAAAGQMQADTQAIDSGNYFGGLYGSFNGSSHFLDLSLTAGLADYSSDRRVANNMVAGGIEHAEADYLGFFISPSITLGSAIHMDNGGTLTPSVRSRYAGLFMGSYDESGSASDLSVDSRNVNILEVRGELAYGLAPLQQEGGVLNATLRLGVDGTYSNGDDVDAVLAGTALSFNGGNNDKSARGFSGLDLRYTSNNGSSFHVSGEAGYDSNDSLSLQAAAGFEIPL